MKNYFSELYCLRVTVETLSFLKECKNDSHIIEYDGEDMPEAPKCVKGSKKVSEEQFYALCF